MKKTENLEWSEISCEHIVRNKWIDFRKVRYRFPDGKESDPFYSYSRSSYVVIVAEDEAGNFLCVRQYRYGIGRITVEFPAGGLAYDGDENYRIGNPSQTESTRSILEDAKRELLEETGCISDEWTHLLSIPSNPSLADNFAHIYYAKNCKRVENLHLDDTEFLEPERYRAEEIEKMIRDETFIQPIHVMAWLMLKDQGREK